MTTQVYKEPVQLYVMPRNRALNIEPLAAGRTPLKVADGNVLLLAILDKAEELSLDIKAWVPALTEGMSKDEASKHKQWSPKAIRALIAACPTSPDLADLIRSNDMDVELIGYSYVVFNGKFGPYAAILADNPEYAEKLTKEVIDL